VNGGWTAGHEGKDQAHSQLIGSSIFEKPPLSGSLGTKQKMGKLRQINCILLESKGKLILKNRKRKK